MLYRTYRIHVIHDDPDMAYLPLPAFRRQDIQHLHRMVPDAAMWYAADEFGSNFNITTVHAQELYDMLVALLDREMPSDEPYVVGYTFGNVPTVNSELGLVNTLVPYLEYVLEVEKPRGITHVRQFVEHDRV